MSERTEEEQIEAIKSWWRRNGTSLLLGALLAVALLVGWQAWQNHQTEQRMAASARFQELLGALNTPPAEDDEERQSSSVGYLADQLRSEHEDSVYAVLGSILEGSYRVENGEAEAALASLEWALDHAGEPPLSLVVRERLARAQFTAGQHDEALATLDGVADPGAFRASYKELEGDILKDRGDRAGARAAYQAALDSSGNAGQSPLLQYKMADVAASGDA